MRPVPDFSYVVPDTDCERRVYFNNGEDRFRFSLETLLLNLSGRPPYISLSFSKQYQQFSVHLRSIKVKYSHITIMTIGFGKFSTSPKEVMKTV